MGKKTFRLGNKEIGPGCPVYIIAEAGVNHNGDLHTALELVREAKKAGADCVKFQTFRAEAIVTKSAPKAAYQLQTTDPKESQIEMLKKLELPESHYREILALCSELGIQFLSTPYGRTDIEFLGALHVDGFKVASGQLVENPFLEALAKTGKPIILSTGMGTMAEVKEAVETIRAAGNGQLVVLQCTTNYPSAVEDANLRAMLAMGEALDVTIGYSDHTESNYCVFAATALGATVIEKHFTLDRKMDGPDHSSSVEPGEFAEMVQGIRAIERGLGSAVKQPTATELRNITGMRRSLVAAADLAEGTVLKESHLTFKRPGSGMKPNTLPRLLGKRLKCAVTRDTLLTEEMIEW